MADATKIDQESVLQASNFTVSIDNKIVQGVVDFVNVISGGAVKVDTQAVTGGKDSFVQNASGRPVCELLTIETLVTKKNALLIKAMSEFMKDTQSFPRTTITYQKLDRSLAATPKQKVWHEAFCTSLTHPACNNEGTALKITTVWQANRCDNNK